MGSGKLLPVDFALPAMVLKLPVDKTARKQKWLRGESGVGPGGSCWMMPEK